MPADGGLVPLHAGADLPDAIAIALPVEAPADLVALARAAFERPAGWIRALTRARAMAVGGRELVAATVVHCRNNLGRAYLTLIAPLHRVIVKANLERAARMIRGPSPTALPSLGR